MTDDELRTVLADRVRAVRTRIAAACARADRDPAGVTLVAVTKTVGARVAGLLPEMGVADLGENRPQTLWAKAAALAGRGIRWHLIGHLQRNKVEQTLPHVELIHSIDSLRLLHAVAAAGAKLGRRPRVLLQINASREGQKQGFDYAEVLAAADEIRAASVEVVGLMGMAAFADDPEAARPTFAELRRFRDHVRGEWGVTLPELSMGMSGDFEVAVEEGATLVRVGTTLLSGMNDG
jgi:pyridoxal phosphate enzyme (YggS family)